ncbi:hypothetical protein I4U23_022352 [Adineta vaga]|nr:hypothetical protein I4U23_022352 [Adineta vaga]
MFFKSLLLSTIMMSMYFYASAMSPANDGIWTGTGYNTEGLRYNVYFLADSSTFTWKINYGLVGGEPNFCGGYWTLSGVNRFREVITYGKCVNTYCDLVFTNDRSISTFRCSLTGPFTHGGNLTRLHKFC